MTNPVKILIVEDELLIAKNTARKLKKFGYNVGKIVSTGQAAIDFVTQENPDLVLMDIAIKGEIDGIETASQIKGISNVPIIFMTAYTNDETLDRAAETGCYGYLIKPYKEKELQATVKMTLRKHLEQSTIEQANKPSKLIHSEEYGDIYQDGLTRLPNKLLIRDLFDYLSSLISKEDHTGSETKSEPNLIAVFNISLDRLAKIKSFLSLENQNDLVKEIAERLKTCVNSFPAHGSTIYLEDDNFVVLLATDKRLSATKYGASVLDTLKQSLIIGDREIYLSPIIGISFCPSDSTDITELLSQSYKAIEHAKSNGGNRCQIFTFGFNIKSYRALDDLRLESELYRALERQEFELYYQPKLDLKTNRIVGSEALLRWNHSKMGRINADKFIPIAEDVELIKPIGEWVLTTACQQMQTWLDAGINTQQISVNLSGVQFKQSDLSHKITQILFETSLEPQFLELELTETILVENIKANVHKLNMLKKLGVQISLDDFGTGYSSFGYLQQFPFDILKIDSCFIRNVDQNQVNAVITRSIIEMAHKLGLKVVAEGVETTAELDFLNHAQCDVIQGFFFSRPLSAQKFEQLVKENSSLLQR